MSRMKFNLKKRSRLNSSITDRFRLKMEDSPETEGAIEPLEEESVETEEPKAEKKKDSEPGDDLAKLKRALEKERAASKAAKALAAQRDTELAKFAEINPDEYKELVKERENYAKLQAERDAIEARLKQEKQTFLTKHQRELAEKEAEISNLHKQFQSLEKTTALKEIFLAEQGNPKVADDGSSHFKLFSMLEGDRFAFDDSKNVIVLNADGTQMMSATEKDKPMTPAEYIRSLHQHPVLGACFVADVPSGLGANHGSVKTPAKPKSYTEMSSSERIAAYSALRQK